MVRTAENVYPAGASGLFTHSRFQLVMVVAGATFTPEAIAQKGSIV